MKVLSVVGARPQLVKLAPIANALTADGHQHVIVHTGQHYEQELSGVFFRDLGIPRPDLNLEVGSGSHAQQTAAMLPGLEQVILEQAPDWVLVYGDTNSTLAGTLAAVKVDQPAAHLEAGLRSFNRRMPEEHNRVLTDHAVDLLLAPTQQAVEHLGHEGLDGRTVLVGDVMTDVLYRARDSLGTAGKLPLPPGVSASDDYILATVHRAENTDDPRRLAQILNALNTLPCPVVLLAHPRLRARAAQAGLSIEAGAIRLMPPQPYPVLIGLLQSSAAVVTDSGGLQKEAFLLRVPCTTIRHETEWTETLDLGWNELNGDLAHLERSVLRPTPPPTDQMPYGDGHAAEHVVAALTGTTP